MTSQCVATDFNHTQPAKRRRITARSPLHWLITRWSALKQQKTNRLALKELSSLDDAMLKDIGISRQDVAWASKLPSSVSASVELEIIARRRSP